jgi:hypothetical protein
LTGSATAEERVSSVKGKTYYVRQTIGNDANDGLSPETAWHSISKLSNAMEAGSIAYVGPGLYREEIRLQHNGTAENRITLIADTKGDRTGDPPGVVMIAGSEPVDENIFEPYYSRLIFLIIMCLGLPRWMVNSSDMIELRKKQNM